jgi:hypothetical protein
MAKKIITGALAAVANGTGQVLKDSFNVDVSGTFVATLAVQRSFDGGTTWSTISRDASGTPATFTAPFSIQVSEPEVGVQYRVAMTAFTSGSANYRMSGYDN